MRTRRPGCGGRCAARGGHTGHPYTGAATRRGWPYRPPLHRSRHPARSVNCSDIASRRAADSRPYGENRKIMRKTTGLHAPRLPCVRGPQGSDACGRKSDSSGWTAVCLGGPQRRPGRLSGNPDHRPLRKQKGQMASRNHRTLHKRPLRGADARCAPLRAPRGAQLFTFHASLFVQFAPLRRRCGIGTFAADAPVTGLSGRLIAAPTMKSRTGGNGGVTQIFGPHAPEMRRKRQIGCKNTQAPAAEYPPRALGRFIVSG